jgi:hypothetical protein
VDLAACQIARTAAQGPRRAAEIFVWRGTLSLFARQPDEPEPARQAPNQGRMQMSDRESRSAKENLKGGQQETKEPWKRPDQSGHEPGKNSPPRRPPRAEDSKTN